MLTDCSFGGSAWLAGLAAGFPLVGGIPFTGKFPEK